MMEINLLHGDWQRYYQVRKNRESEMTNNEKNADFEEVKND